MQQAVRVNPTDPEKQATYWKYNCVSGVDICMKGFTDDADPDNMDKIRWEQAQPYDCSNINKRHPGAIGSACAQSRGGGAPNIFKQTTPKFNKKLRNGLLVAGGLALTIGLIAWAVNSSGKQTA